MHLSLVVRFLPQSSLPIVCSAQANFLSGEMRIFLCLPFCWPPAAFNPKWKKNPRPKDNNKETFEKSGAHCSALIQLTSPFFSVLYAHKTSKKTFFRPVMDEAIYKAQMKTRHISLRCDSLLLTNAVNNKEKWEVDESYKRTEAVFAPFGVS